jgi:predicted RNase H-like HicB family nuclease
MVRTKKPAISQAAIAKILDQPYARELKRNSDGTWFVRVVEFEGCMTEGDTEKEALSNLDDAMRGWVEASLEDGNNIPPPSSDL